MYKNLVKLVLREGVVTHKCEWDSLTESERQDRILTGRSVRDNLLLSYFLSSNKNHPSRAATMLQWPLRSLTFTWSPLLASIISQTMGRRSNTLVIISRGKLLYASLTVLVKASASLLLFRCLHLTADCRLIQMPRSRAFNSGEHGGWNLKITLCCSLNCLVYSSIACLVPCPHALSSIR